MLVENEGNLNTEDGKYIEKLVENKELKGKKLKISFLKSNRGSPTEFNNRIRDLKSLFKDFKPLDLDFDLKQLDLSKGGADTIYNLIGRFKGTPGSPESTAERFAQPSSQSKSESTSKIRNFMPHLTYSCPKENSVSGFNELFEKLKKEEILSFFKDNFESSEIIDASAKKFAPLLFSGDQSFSQFRAWFDVKEGHWMAVDTTGKSPLYGSYYYEGLKLIESDYTINHLADKWFLIGQVKDGDWNVRFEVSDYLFNKISIYLDSETDINALKKIPEYSWAKVFGKHPEVEIEVFKKIEGNGYGKLGSLLWNDKTNHPMKINSPFHWSIESHDFYFDGTEKDAKLIPVTLFLDDEDIDNISSRHLPNILSSRMILASKSEDILGPFNRTEINFSASKDGKNCGFGIFKQDSNISALKEGRAEVIRLEWNDPLQSIFFDGTSDKRRLSLRNAKDEFDREYENLLAKVDQLIVSIKDDQQKLTFDLASIASHEHTNVVLDLKEALSTFRLCLVGNKSDHVLRADLEGLAIVGIDGNALILHIVENSPLAEQPWIKFTSENDFFTTSVLIKELKYIPNAEEVRDAALKSLYEWSPVFYASMEVEGGSTRVVKGIVGGTNNASLELSYFGEKLSSANLKVDHVDFVKILRGQSDLIARLKAFAPLRNVEDGAAHGVIIRTDNAVITWRVVPDTWTAQFFHDTEISYEKDKKGDVTLTINSNDIDLSEVLRRVETSKVPFEKLVVGNDYTKSIKLEKAAFTKPGLKFKS